VIGFLSVIGAVCLAVLAFKFLPVLLGVFITVGVLILVGFILAGFITLLGPVIIFVLLVAGVIWILKKLFNK
jgi:hypothetical protein